MTTLTTFWRRPPATVFSGADGDEEHPSCELNELAVNRDLGWL
jgi:hypothetical protein